uniref:Dynamin-type G domain-containing protein n=2 Tax=Macrostomum lignano TaxID=282301 RepID=A0A1I8JFR4_9PLAT
MNFDESDNLKKQREIRETAEMMKKIGAQRRFRSFDRLSAKLRLFLDSVDLIRSEEGEQLKSELFEVVVVGDQSDGKSTLLEAITGVQLPKGTGICTRCPIRLIIREAETESASIQINEQPSREVSDLSKLESELQRAQDDVVAGRKTSTKPITVKVNGPLLPNISVVDLPGINRETGDREQETVELIKKWITPQETIVIVIAKATNDIAASKGYQLAQEVDPDNKRTFLVITNCDGSLENKETDIQKLFSEKKKKLFAVKCFRSTADTTATSREELMNHEAQFFAQHKLFKHYSQNTGTAQLIQSLEALLCKKIEPHQQKILRHARRRVRELEKELEDLKTGESKFMDCVDECVFDIRTEIRDQVTGSDESEYRDNKLYQKCRDEWMNAGTMMREESANFKKDLLSTIRKECEAQRGRQLEQLPNNSPVLERIIGRLIESFKTLVGDTTQATQSYVHEELVKIVRNNLQKKPLLRGLQQLEEILTDGCKNQMDKLKEKAHRKVLEILDMQKVIFLNNPKIDDLFSKMAHEKDEQAAEHAPEKKAKSLLQIIEDCAKDWLETSDSAGSGAVQAALVGIMSKLGLHPPISQLLVIAALNFLPWWFSQPESKDQSFDHKDDEHRLVCLTYVYIELVCDRTADAVPMAIIHFFNKRLAADVCKLIPHPKWEDLKNLSTCAQQQQKIESASDSLRRWKDIVAQLCSPTSDETSAV